MQRMQILAAALAFVLGASHAADCAEMLELRYGETASPLQSIFSLPILVAEREGFFTRHGLHVSIVPVMGGGESTITALEQGIADVSHVATSFLISAALKGSDAVAIAAEFNNPIYSLVAKSSFKSIDELKGRRLGMADMTGTVSLSTLALLAKHGISQNDVSIKVIEGTPTRYNCLVQGACDAVPLGQPQDFFAQRQGYRILGLSSDAVPDFLYTVTAVRRSWAASHEEELVRYVRALRDAFIFIRNPAERDRVVRTLMDAWGSSESAARSTLALYFEPERNVLPREGEISMSGMRQVIRFLDQDMFKGKVPEPERFVDRQYLRAAGIADPD